MTEHTVLSFQDKDITIINDNVLTTSAIKPGSIDLIVTSPPYNVDIQYNSHKDDVSYAEYLQFSKEWLANCFEWLGDSGRLCLNVPLDKNKGGQQSVGADFTCLAKEIGYQYHSTVIWNEGNISRRTAWGSWKSASAPFVIAPVELIIILYKHSWKKLGGSKISDVTRDEFMNWTNGLWTFNGESKKRIGHPAPFPLELPVRCIKMFSYVGDTVLDPFLGSGTSLIAAAMLERKGIGIDVDERYCKLAEKRILNSPELLQKKLPLTEMNNDSENGERVNT
jgi:site-specific DNA-methyltransferase (adenine-specific)